MNTNKDLMQRALMAARVQEALDKAKKERKRYVRMIKDDDGKITSHISSGISTDMYRSILKRNSKKIDEFKNSQKIILTIH